MDMAGRPTKYDPSFADAAKAICEMGATITEVAETLGVHECTVKRWSNKHPEFRYAIKVGKEPADDRVERSLYQRAIGYSVTETKREYEIREQEDGDPVRVLVKEQVTDKHVHGDVAAAFIWLKNRRPAEWRDRKELTGPDGGPMEVSNLTDMELARRLVSMIDRATQSAE